MHKHYASTGIGRSVRQVLYALRTDQDAVARGVAVRAKRLRHDEARMAGALGRPVSGLDILIVGPGYHLFEPRFFGLRNKVTALDLDVIPCGFDPAAYWRMMHLNGPGRFAKTLGRKLLGVDRRLTLALKHELGVDRLPRPIIIQGDILDSPPAQAAYDVAACWSVFQHLPDPALALRNMKSALRPGGVIFIGIHLYTSNTGHHDIRAFTGGAGDLPPWAHLRPATGGMVTPSAWLNQWRLRDWRAMLEEQAPGFQEFREACNDSARRMLTPGIRAELADFDDVELLTNDVYFLWRKPV